MVENPKTQEKCVEHSRTSESNIECLLLQEIDGDLQSHRRQ